MKMGWKIIVGVIVFCTFVIAFRLIQRSESSKRINVELPTAVLSQSQLAIYPKPDIYPDARNVQVKLITRQGCIDNCEPFEPLKGLGGKVTEFQTLSTHEDILSFYKRTLTRVGWQFDQEYSGGEHIYHFQKKDGPRFSLTISIDSLEGMSYVQLYEEVSTPFTWPNS